MRKAWLEKTKLTRVPEEEEKKKMWRTVLEASKTNSRIHDLPILRVELRSLCLGAVPLEPHPQPFLLLIIFEIVSCFMFGPAWTAIFLFVLLSRAGNSGHRPQCFAIG
jgi:hypothetical protein